MTNHVARSHVWKVESSPLALAGDHHRRVRREVEASQSQARRKAEAAVGEHVLREYVVERRGGQFRAGGPRQAEGGGRARGQSEDCGIKAQAGPEGVAGEGRQPELGVDPELGHRRVLSVDEAGGLPPQSLLPLPPLRSPILEPNLERTSWVKFDIHAGGKCSGNYGNENGRGDIRLAPLWVDTMDAIVPGVAISNASPSFSRHFSSVDKLHGCHHLYG